MDPTICRVARRVGGARSEVPWGLAALWFFVAGVSPAHAYIDPGSGAMLFQLLAAVFLGASYSVFRGWKRIRAFFSNLLGEKPGGPGRAERKRE
jgi:hypothetical protein